MMDRTLFSELAIFFIIFPKLYRLKTLKKTECDSFGNKISCFESVNKRWESFFDFFPIFPNLIWGLHPILKSLLSVFNLPKVPQKHPKCLAWTFSRIRRLVLSRHNISKFSSNNLPCNKKLFHHIFKPLLFCDNCSSSFLEKNVMKQSYAFP